MDLEYRELERNILTGDIDSLSRIIKFRVINYIMTTKTKRKTKNKIRGGKVNRQDPPNVKTNIEHEEPELINPNVNVNDEMDDEVIILQIYHRTDNLPFQLLPQDDVWLNVLIPIITDEQFLLLRNLSKLLNFLNKLIRYSIKDTRSFINEGLKHPQFKSSTIFYYNVFSYVYLNLRPNIDALILPIQIRTELILNFMNTHSNLQKLDLVFQCAQIDNIIFNI